MQRAKMNQTATAGFNFKYKWIFKHIVDVQFWCILETSGFPWKVWVNGYTLGILRVLKLKVYIYMFSWIPSGHLTACYVLSWLRFG